MRYVNFAILMLTSVSASVIGCLITFSAVSAPEGAAIGGVVSGLAVGWHSASTVLTTRKVVSSGTTAAPDLSNSVG